MHLGVHFWPIIALGVKRVQGLAMRGLANATHADLRDVLNRGSTHPAIRGDDLSPDRRVLPGR
jgi:hypothetical protein